MGKDNMLMDKKFAWRRKTVNGLTSVLMQHSFMYSFAGR
jgi:hypothetical protein